MSTPHPSAIVPSASHALLNWILIPMLWVMFFSICRSLLRKLSIREVKLLAPHQQLEVAEPRLKRIFAKLSTGVQPHPHIPPGSACLLFLVKASLSLQIPGSWPPPPRWCSLSHLLSVFSTFSCSTHSFLSKKHSQNSHVPVAKWLPSYLATSHHSSNGMLLGKGPQTQSPLPLLPPPAWLGWSGFYPPPTESALATTARYHFTSKL